MKSKSIGEIDDFDSIVCFEKYLFAVKLANTVNEHIDSGHIVFYHKAPVYGRFKFIDGVTPEVFILIGDNYICFSGDWSYDQHRKIKISEKVTKNSILKMFHKFCVVRPESMERVRYLAKEK